MVDILALLLELVCHQNAGHTGTDCDDLQRACGWVLRGRVTFNMHNYKCHRGVQSERLTS
jgi:hypothetical protein